MMGPRQVDQAALFYEFSLQRHVPATHVLRWIDRFVGRVQPNAATHSANFLSRRLIEQGLSRPFIELPCDGTELGLAVQGQIGATRKILAQQSVGVFV